jgi:ribosomal protein S1
MKYKITNFIQSEDGKQKFYEGQTVHFGREDGGGRSGTITRISSKGVYFDVGGKTDKYIRIDEVFKVLLLE